MTMEIIHRLGGCPLRFRGNLLVRLLWVVAAAAAPAMLVLGFQLYDAQTERTQIVANAMSRKSGSVQADLSAIADGARDLINVIGGSEAIWGAPEACQPELQSMLNGAVRFGLFAVLDEAGHTLCAANIGGPVQIPPLENLHSLSLSASDDFSAGLYLADPALPPGLLPYAQTIRRGAASRVVVVALRLDWLNAHIQSISRMPDSRIVVADRAGTILAHAPANPPRLGKPMRADSRALLAETDRRVLRLPAGAPDESLISIAPAGRSGLFVLAGVPTAAMNAAQSASEWRGVIVMLLGVTVALIGSFFAAQRLIRRPARVLVESARAWARGDLAVRVQNDPADRSEFARMAHAFNHMAGDLERRIAEREAMQQELEDRVADRTRDLLLSRDRLQIALGEQAKSEASLRQAQKMQMVGQLAGGIAHDFNNLLTALIGALDMLRPRLPDADLRSLRLLDNAMQAAERGARLTSQLLAFSRRQRLQPVPTNLNDVIVRMMDLLTTTIGRDIDIRTECAPMLRHALVDPNQMEAAILNLVLNARDALPKGGVVTIRTAALDLVVPELLPGAVSELPAGRYVSVCVEDNGTGIAPEMLSRVFEPFFTTKGSGQGSGLGLSQVHGLAAQSNGTARIESTLGRGTKVCVVLPAVTAEMDRLPPPPVSTEKVVAIVDDDPAIRALVADMLIELGHRPILLSDPEIAITQVQSSVRLDVLIVDQVMPGMTGVELISHVRMIRPELAIILATGHAEREAFARDVADSDLAKPFSVASLSSAIELALSRHAPQVTVSA